MAAKDRPEFGLKKHIQYNPLHLPGSICMHDPCGVYLRDFNTSQLTFLIFPHSSRGITDCHQRIFGSVSDSALYILILVSEW